MKIVQKIICVLLSIGMVLCCTVSVSAIEPRITFVGTFTIFSSNDEDNSSFSIKGHAFVSFKNTSTLQIKIGGLNVNPGHEITIGTWGNMPANHKILPNQTWHKGIWYNLESYLANEEKAFSNRVSLTMGVTINDVRTINSVISKSDSWSPTNNCSSFATKIWNSIASSKLKLSAGNPNTPKSLSTNIKLISGYQSNRAIMNMRPIGYVNSNGSFASVTISANGGGQHRSLKYNYIPNTLEVA